MAVDAIRIHIGDKLSLRTKIGANPREHSCGIDVKTYDIDCFSELIELSAASIGIVQFRHTFEQLGVGDDADSDTRVGCSREEFDCARAAVEKIRNPIGINEDARQRASGGDFGEACRAL